MLQTLKKYFIPHEQNDHQPYILRWEAILVIFGCVLAVEIFFLAQVFVLEPLSGLFSSILPSALTDLTNFNRQQSDLPGLAVSPLLRAAAELKAQDMAAKGYFSHTSPDGLTPWFWLKKAGYEYITAGENLAVNFVDSQDVANAWMNSPAHRANILNNNFTEVGIAEAKGIYNGQETIFIAQFFGRPKTKEVVVTEATRPKSETRSEGAATPIIANAPSSEPAAASSTLETFALVLGESQNTPSQSASPVVPLKEQATENKSPFLASLQIILSEPRTMTNYLFLMILTIVATALILKIFIKIKIQHPPLIINGLIVLLFISFAMWLNQFLGLYQAKIF